MARSRDKTGKISFISVSFLGDTFLKLYTLITGLLDNEFFYFHIKHQVPLNYSYLNFSKKLKKSFYSLVIDNFEKAIIRKRSELLMRLEFHPFSTKKNSSRVL